MLREGWVKALLFLHVLGAVTALGPSLTYGLWARLGERAGRRERAFALRTISWVDRRLATPSYVAQLVTGLLLVWLLRLDLLGTGWLVLSLAIYAAILVLAMGLYAPTFRRQVALAERLDREADDPDLAAQYRSLAARTNAYSVAAAGLTLAILFLMVVQPELW